MKSYLNGSSIAVRDFLFLKVRCVTAHEISKTLQSLKFSNFHFSFLQKNFAHTCVKLVPGNEIFTPVNFNRKTFDGFHQSVSSQFQQIKKASASFKNEMLTLVMLMGSPAMVNAASMQSQPPALFLDSNLTYLFIAAILFGAFKFYKLRKKDNLKIKTATKDQKVNKVGNVIMLQHG